MSTADRYREAGMPPPKGEVYLPASKLTRRRRVQTAGEAAKRLGIPVELAPGGPAAHIDPLPERVHDPAVDGPVLPDLPASAYGPDSVPLDPPDADNTEEQS